MQHNGSQSDKTVNEDKLNQFIGQMLGIWAAHPVSPWFASAMLWASTRRYTPRGP
jgi:hypothetical protein